MRWRPSPRVAASLTAGVGITGTTRADDAWGPGSWYQRSLALMYGGDPLAVPANGPWRHPLGYTVPGPQLTSDLGGLEGLDWPSRQESGYITTEIWRNRKSRRSCSGAAVRPVGAPVGERWLLRPDDSRAGVGDAAL